jgi:hypothetical protein
MGVGDATRASSWACVDGNSRTSESVFEDESYDHEGMQQPQEVAKHFAAHVESEENSDMGRAGQVLEGLKDRLESLGMGLRFD